MKTWMGRVGLLLAIVAVLAAGVAPWAQGQTEPVTYYACVSNAKGVMRLVSEGQQCSKNEHLIDWNRLGPAGECTCPFTLAELQSLEARVAALEGEPDADGDGWPASVDCDDADSAVYPGAVELCDGRDNDCDGLVDEDCPLCVPGSTQACYPGPAGLAGVGVCTTGIQTCDSEGQWDSCLGAVLPSDEACDGLDNDCDGETDEGCP